MLAPPYVPVPIHVYDQRQYAADDAECRSAGAAWVPSFSGGSTAASAVKGATGESSMIPVNPLVPLYGAGGALVGSLADGLDVASGQHANVYRNCLHDETQIDRSAVVANPKD